MKRYFSILTLILTLAIVTMCGVGACAEEGRQVYALYPMQSETGNVQENNYNADFSKDIIITLEDLPTGLWKLELVNCEFADFTDESAKKKAKEDWGKYIEKNKQLEADENGFLKLKGIQDRIADVAYGKKLSFTIKSTKEIKNYNYFILAYSIVPEDGTEPVLKWKGKFNNVSNDKNAVEKIVLSMLQFRIPEENQKDDEGWVAEMDANLNPEAIEVRAAPGLSIVDEKKYQDEIEKDATLADRVYAKRWIDAWRAEGAEEPVAIYAVQDDGATGEIVVLKREEYIASKATEESSDATTETSPSEPTPSTTPRPTPSPTSAPTPTPTPTPTPEPGDPLTLTLTDTVNSVSTIIAAEDADGKLASQDNEDCKYHLAPGNYQLTLTGGDATKGLIYAVKKGKSESELKSLTDEPIQFTVKAGQSNTLCLWLSKQGDGPADAASPDLELELLGMISEPIEITGAQIVSQGDSSGGGNVLVEDALTEGFCVNQKHCVEGYELVVSGTAQSSVKLSWSVSPTGQKDSVRTKAGNWQARISLDDNDLKDFEGSLQFSINYDVNKEMVGTPDSFGDEEKDGSEDDVPTEIVPTVLEFKVDTLAPDASMKIGYAGETVEVDETNDPIIFAKQQDGELTVSWNDGAEGPVELPFDSDEMPNNMTVKQGEDGWWTVRNVVADDAGNESRVETRVRVVQPIEITSIELVDQEQGSHVFKEDAWINAVGLGKTLVISGRGEPNEELVYRFTQKPGVDSEKQEMWNQCEETDGIWSASYNMDIAPETEALTFDIRYNNETLKDDKCTVNPITWRVDIVPPEAPVLSISDVKAQEGNKPIGLIAGRDYDLAIAQPDGTVTTSFVLALNDVDMTEAAALGVYSFNAESSRYRFSATAQDEAGNISEPATLEAVGAKKIAIALADNTLSGKETLNAHDVEGGLGLAIDADSDRPLAVTWWVEEESEKKQKAVVQNDGRWTVDLSGLSNTKAEGSVKLVVSAVYADDELDEAIFGDLWTNAIDLWPPEVLITGIATSGYEKDVKAHKYFYGEPVAVQAQTTGDIQAQTTGDVLKLYGNSTELTEISDVEFNAFVKQEYISSIKNDEPIADVTSQYFMLDGEKNQGERLKLVAVASDKAGNERSVQVEMEPHTKLERIELQGAATGTPTITGADEGAGSVTFSGRAELMYYLVSDDLPGKKIPVPGSGKWTLKLDKNDLDDLPGVIADGPWSFTLKYPDDRYNDADTICEVSVQVDIECKLDWADQEPPMEGDRDIRVMTDPGATVELFDQNTNKIGDSMLADENGLAVFSLSEPITQGAVFAVQARDKNGNISALLQNDGGVTQTADHAEIEAVKIKQTGSGTIDVTGTAAPNTRVVLIYADEAEEETVQHPEPAVVDENGRFRFTDVQVGDQAVSVRLIIKYQGIYAEDEFSTTFSLDRTPPELTSSQSSVSDLGGKVTLQTEVGATLSFEAAGIAIDPVTAVEDEVAVELPPLEGASQVIVRATDGNGNVSAPVALAVKVSTRLKAGLDRPAEGEKQDSEGQAHLTGWIVSADEDPGSLNLIVEQDNKREIYSIEAIPDDKRLEDQTFKAAAGNMFARHCWSFDSTLNMKAWGKGAIKVSLALEAGEELASRTFYSAMDEERRNTIIAICVALAVALVACLLAVYMLNRSIRRITEGKINPENGMTQLTERSHQTKK